MQLALRLSMIYFESERTCVWITVSHCPHASRSLSSRPNPLLDENRGHLLEAGFPQTVLSLLEAFAETMPALPPITPHPLSLEHLKVIKVCIGVSLNSSLGYGMLCLPWSVEFSTDLGLRTSAISPNLFGSSQDNASSYGRTLSTRVMDIGPSHVSGLASGVLEGAQ